jgi:MFS family permease
MKHLLKITILSLSFLTIITGAAVAPSLSIIGNHFPTTDPLYIKLVLTLPSLLLVPFSMLSGKLAETINKKKIIVIGLLLYIIGGFGAVFIQSIGQLLLMRAILGVGIGLILPLSTGLIADYYYGEERAKLMGLSTAVNNLGAVMAILLSGILASIHWRYIFLIYTVAIFILLLVIFFLKNPPRSTSTTADSNYDKKSLIKLVMSMFILQIIFGAVPTNLSLFIDAFHIGPPRISSIFLSILTLSSFLAGLFYTRLSMILKTQKITLSFLTLSIGFIFLSSTSSPLMIALAILLIGLAAGILVPTFMLQVADLVPKNKTSAALALLTSALFLGQFVSPIISNIVEKAFKLNPVLSPFYMGAGLSLLFVLYTFISKE